MADLKSKNQLWEEENRKLVDRMTILEVEDKTIYLIVLRNDAPYFPTQLENPGIVMALHPNVKGMQVVRVYGVGGFLFSVPGGVFQKLTLKGLKVDYLHGSALEIRSPEISLVGLKKLLMDSSD